MTKEAISFRKRIIFSGLIVLIFFALLEITLRFAGFAPKPNISHGASYQDSKFTFDPDLGWKLVPGWNGFEGGGDVRINSMGMRGGELPPRSQNTIRIICLGDSVTFGWKLPENTSYPEILQKKLNEQYNSYGINFQAINASVPGYSTNQELAWLKRDLI